VLFTKHLGCILSVQPFVPTHCFKSLISCITLYITVLLSVYSASSCIFQCCYLFILHHPVYFSVAINLFCITLYITVLLSVYSASPCILQCCYLFILHHPVYYSVALRFGDMGTQRSPVNSLSFDYDKQIRSECVCFFC
jgi:hypothetical protein